MEETREQYFNRVAGKNTYILSESLDDRKRLVSLVKMLSPAFKQAIQRILDKFELQPRLQDPTTTFRILDLGCGEGLYFPILADYLKEQGAKARLVMVGLDRDPIAVATGQEYMAVLGLPDVQLHTCDLSNSLWQLEDLDLTRPENHFDLVYASLSLMHIRGARQRVPEIFQILRPGGVFFTKDMPWAENYLKFPSPTYMRLSDMMQPFLLKVIGDNYGLHQAQYMSEAGFEGVETFEDKYPVGGRSEIGRRWLENMILGQHASRPMVEKLGIMTLAEYDRAMEQEFKEISPDEEGFIILRNTIGRRSLATQ